MTADVAPGHFLAIDQDDERGRGLHAARVEARVDAVAFEEVEAVFAVGREDVREVHAATGAERKAIPVLVLRDRAEAGLTATAATTAVEDAGHLRDRLADRALRDLAGGRQVLLHEGGGHAERAGDVVESLDLDLGRQDLLRINAHADQRFHRGGEFDPVEALDGNVADLAGLGRGVHGRLEVFDEGIDVGLTWLLLASGGHQPTAQLEDGLFPDLGLGAGMRHIEGVESQASGPVSGVVALATVVIDQVIEGLRRAGGRGARRGGACRTGAGRARTCACGGALVGCAACATVAEKASAEKCNDRQGRRRQRDRRPGRTSARGNYSRGPWHTRADPLQRLFERCFALAHSPNLGNFVVPLFCSRNVHLNQCITSLRPFRWWKQFCRIRGGGGRLVGGRWVVQVSASIAGKYSFRRPLWA